MRILLVLFGLMTAVSRAQSVLPNGDFEQADPSNPAKAAHWDLSDGLGVQWTKAPDMPNAPPHGKAIRMDTSVPEKTMMASYAKAGLTQWIFPNPSNDPIGYAYGLSLYSQAVPIVPGKTYRVTFDFMGNPGVGGKLWFRAYADVNGAKKRVYEGTVDCKSTGKWEHMTGLFHPTRYRPNVAEFKIMLFAIATIPNGVGWFDNVKVEAIDEPPQN
jgi:hypothetical protein